MYTDFFMFTNVYDAVRSLTAKYRVLFEQEGRSRSLQDALTKIRNDASGKTFVSATFAGGEADVDPNPGRGDNAGDDTKSEEGGSGDAATDVGNDADIVGGGEDDEDAANGQFDMNKTIENLKRYKRSIITTSHTLDRQLTVQITQTKNLIEKVSSFDKFTADIRIPEIDEFKYVFEMIDSILESLNQHRLNKVFDTPPEISLQELYDALFDDSIRKKLTKLGIEKAESGLPEFTSLKNMSFTNKKGSPKEYLKNIDFVKQLSAYMSINKASQYIEKVVDCLEGIKDDNDKVQKAMGVVDMVVTTLQQLVVALFTLKTKLVNTIAEVNRAFIAFTKNTDENEITIAAKQEHEQKGHEDLSPVMPDYGYVAPTYDLSHLSLEELSYLMERLDEIDHYIGKENYSGIERIATDPIFKKAGIVIPGMEGVGTAVFALIALIVAGIIALVTKLLGWWGKAKDFVDSGSSSSSSSKSSSSSITPVELSNVSKNIKDFGDITDFLALTKKTDEAVQQIKDEEERKPYAARFKELNDAFVALSKAILKLKKASYKLVITPSGKKLMSLTAIDRYREALAKMDNELITKYSDIASDMMIGIKAFSSDQDSSFGSLIAKVFFFSAQPVEPKEDERDKIINYAKKLSEPLGLMVDEHARWIKLYETWIPKISRGSEDNTKEVDANRFLDLDEWIDSNGIIKEAKVEPVQTFVQAYSEATPKITAIGDSISTKLKHFGETAETIQKSVDKLKSSGARVLLLFAVKHMKNINSECKRIVSGMPENVPYDKLNETFKILTDPSNKKIDDATKKQLDECLKKAQMVMSCFSDVTQELRNVASMFMAVYQSISTTIVKCEIKPEGITLEEFRLAQDLEKRKKVREEFAKLLVAAEKKAKEQSEAKSEAKSE